MSKLQIKVLFVTKHKTIHYKNHHVNCNECRSAVIFFPIFFRFWYWSYAFLVEYIDKEPKVKDAISS